MKEETGENYSKPLLIELLSQVEFDLQISTVQELANEIENKIIPVVDSIAPISKFINNRLEQTKTVPFWVKRKINLRKRKRIILNSLPLVFKKIA